MVVVLVATTVLSGRLPWSAASIPLVETPMQGATVIDVPTKDSSLAIAPGKAGRLDADGASLIVPAGAALANSTVTVKLLQEPFHMTMWQSPEEVGTNPTVVGPVVDFGPEGSTFNEPVTVSIPYSRMALPSGASEDSIVPAYWNGQSWVAVAGTVDKSAHTVSVRLKDFKGIGLAAIAAAGPYVALGAVIVGTVSYAGYNAYKWLKGDAITQGKASDWITPDTAIVQKYAKQAVITDATTHVQMSLQDPNMPAWLAAGSAQGHAMDLGYISNVGQPQAIGHDEQGYGWQTPDHFFMTGDDKGPLNGDCTDSANSSVSVFIASGFKAKGVFGYAADDGHAHEYAEVAIGGQLYRMDEGGLYTEENWKKANFPTYNPPSSWDRRFDSMWDNKGQQPYNKNWWKDISLTVDPPTISGMTAKFKLSADGIPIITQELSVNWDYGDGVIESSDELKAPYTQPVAWERTHEYKKEGEYKVKVTLYDDTAYNTVPGATADKLAETTVTVKIAAAGSGHWELVKTEGGTPVSDGPEWTIQSSNGSITYTDTSHATLFQGTGTWAPPPATARPGDAWELKLAPSVPCADGDAGAVVTIRALMSLGPEDDPHGTIIEDLAYCVNPHGIGSASTWSFPDPSETLQSSVLIRIDVGQEIGRNGDTYRYHYEWRP